MAGFIQLVFALAIGLAVVCTGVVSKDCEECSIAKCQKIEGSSGKVYGENEKVALSATVCPDEQNCCSFKDTLYYVTGEFAPCVCPDNEFKQNARINDYNGAADGIDDESDKRVWGGVKKDTPGWHEKKAFILLRGVQPDKFKDPNGATVVNGRVTSATDLVPTADSTSYTELFGRVLASGSTETGKIYRLLDLWLTNNKNDVPKAKFDDINKITKHLHRSYELRNEAYNNAKAKKMDDKGHQVMRDAMKRAWSDFVKLEKDHRPATFGAPPPYDVKDD